MHAKSPSGLCASRWAERATGSPSRVTHLEETPSPVSPTAPEFPKAGPLLRSDWTCPICNEVNFQKRTSCFKCLNSAPLSRAAATNTSTSSKLTENAREASQLPSTFLAQLRAGERGLASSRYAFTASATSLRVPVTSDAAIPRPAHRRIPSIDSVQPLPFEFQSRILHLLTSLMEEGLYRFASRYAPSLMTEHPSWTHPSCVEVSTWRMLLSPYRLPSTLPTSLQTEQARAELDSALKSAVKIRNLAVHREVLRTNEIERWIDKAEGLCVLLGDETAMERCNLVGQALREWALGEREMRGWDDRQLRLDHTLRLAGMGVAGEQGMDWSVFDVQAIDVTNHGNGTHRRKCSLGYGSEMDLD